MPPPAHFILREETSFDERDSESLRVIGVDLMDDDRSRVRLRASDDFHRRVEIPIGCMPVFNPTACTPGTALTRRSNLKERDAAFTIRITLLRQRNAHRQQAVGSESELYILHRHECPNHQTGADQQHQRQRDLDDHQTFAQQRLPRAALQTAPCFTQRVGQIATASVQSRGETEDNARHRRHEHCEKQYRGVERDLRLRPVSCSGDDGQYGSQTSERHRHAQRASGQAISRLSVNNWRIRRDRPAPKAARTAISFCRAGPG